MAVALTHPQEFHKLADPEMFNIEVDSPDYMVALGEVLKEVAALLSSVCRHPNIVELVGVVLDDKGRPAKLLLERAGLGDLLR